MSSPLLLPLKIFLIALDFFVSHILCLFCFVLFVREECSAMAHAEFVVLSAANMIIAFSECILSVDRPKQQRVLLEGKAF